MHDALHKVLKRMGGQASKARGARGVRGVHTFLIAKNAPYSYSLPASTSMTSQVTHP